MLQKMLMLLSVHVTSVLFLVWFNNFALTMGFYWSYTLFTLVACSYVLLQHDEMHITGHFKWPSARAKWQLFKWPPICTKSNPLN